MLTTEEFSLPANGLVSLKDAFDMIGTHRFGARWTADMASTVRLGRRSRNPTQRALGCWALKALTQCVEHGWLPLIYFKGNRRVRYFDALEGPALHTLYPQPSEELEGQIELTDRGIYSCVVDTSGFAEVLRQKFTKSAANRTGPRRRFLGFEEELDRYFRDHPLDMRGCEVIHDLGKIIPERAIPSRATAYRLIEAAKNRAHAHLLNTQSETNLRRTALA